MIAQSYTVSIALRYLRARSRNAFISFISAVSMLGIALSVAVLIVVMAVINGFQTELERRILSVVPDASLSGLPGADGTVSDWRLLRDEALARDDVLAAAPYVEGEGLAVAGDALFAVRVRGVDPEAERGISNIAAQFRDGSFDALRQKWTAAIGSQLATELELAVGDELRLHLPNIRRTPFGVQNAFKVLTVGGIFDIGMAEFDRGLVLINLDDAMTLYRTNGRATGIGLSVDNVYNASTIVQAFGQSFVDRFGGSYLPDHWALRYSNVFRSIELTRPILFIVLSLVMAIAAFNIVSTLFMVVREKRGDIAILRSIGSAPGHILKIFIVQGTSIGVIGMLGGLALGLALAASLGTIVGWIESWFAIDLLSAEVYLIGDLPTEVRLDQTLRICLLALGLAMLATVYPAYRAARQPPAEALRNE